VKPLASFWHSLTLPTTWASFLRANHPLSLQLLFVFPGTQNGFPGISKSELFQGSPQGPLQNGSGESTAPFLVVFSFIVCLETVPRGYHTDLKKLCSQGCPWTPEPPTSTSHLLRFQVCVAGPDELFWDWLWIVCAYSLKGFVHHEAKVRDSKVSLCSSFGIFNICSIYWIWSL